MATIRA
ncbi:UNVERIFIED_CONTAM: hypothetical protein GTU68_053746 [Idotea baltica]|nr:hypothetical protein [Idotea baltica]